MTTEGLLVIPQRGGFGYDDDAHQRNIRAIEKWARGAKAFASLIDLGSTPAVANYADGTLVFAGDVLYVRAAGAWEALSLASDLTAHLNDTAAAHAASAVSIADAGGYFTGTEVEAALQELGALPGGSWDVNLTLAADETVTNSTVLADVTGMSFAVVAGEVWECELHFACVSPDVQTDVKVELLTTGTWTTGASSSDGVHYSATGALTNRAPTVFSSTTAALGGLNVNNGDNVVRPVILRFRFLVATSGTVKFQVANVIANSSTSTIKAGAKLLARQLL